MTWLPYFLYGTYRKTTVYYTLMDVIIRSGETILTGCNYAVVTGRRSLAARLPAMICKKRQHIRGQQLFHPSVLPRYVDSHLLPHYRVREFVGGGLNCEAKAQVLVVSSPLYFPESRSQKGGA